jgi:hypothetical protein
MSRTLWYMFIIMVLLIVAVYFAGLVTEGRAFFAGVNQLVLSLTGRTSNGQFAQYPNTPKGV